jgi:subtilase family serine protease
MNTIRSWLVAAAGFALLGVAGAAPYAHGLVSAADIGPASAFAENARVTVTVALKLRNAEQIEQRIEQLYTRGSPTYRQFITPEQFREQFAPDAATVAAVSRAFTVQGLSVTQAATAQLHVSGSAAQIEQAFGVQLRTFQVAAGPGSAAHRYRAPLGAPQVPAAISASVRAVLGLDTQPRLRPHLRHGTFTPSKQGSAPPTPDAPGFWTVTDFAQYYDVDPLYHAGLSGQGRTVGIVTLAAFTPSDAFAYWSALGLNVNPNRITEVQIDGGSGAPSDASGSLETTLDVEQSGGIAPGAHIVVYEAPNTDQGFVDAFAAAIDANRADTVSTSWGQWEGFDGANPVVGDGPVTDPVNGQQTSSIAALDDLLAQAALQGQSFFAAAGDNAAYDTTGSLPLAPSPGEPESFNPVLSVDDPGMQRFMTSGGGTTLPGTQTFTGPTGEPININVATEIAWSWTYLKPLCDAFDQDPVACGTFAVGTGGGVSIYVQRPFYQWFLPGMADSVAKQTLFQLTPAPAQKLYHLPAGFPGRNVPDLSLNADPDTGYVVYYTSDVSGFSVQSFWGGTSFVGPQLNGVTSLYLQALHHRIGLLNPALYFIAATHGYRGHEAPLRDITKGDNWFWHAQPGYDRTTGVGVPDVANLLQALRELEP